MLPGIALPLCALVVLIAMPVRLGAVKTPDAPLKIGVSIGPARRQWRLSPATLQGRPALLVASPRGERLLPLPSKRPERTAASQAAKRAGLFLVKRLRAERLLALVRLNSGDARDTVLWCALIESVLSALTCVLPALPLERRISCAFSGRSEARLMGIFSVRFGHIMLAALVWAREYCFGRIRAWTNTPSKAS